MCWYFLEEKWLFCTYSKSKGHALFIFATLQEEFVLLSQSQGTSLKFLNQGKSFVQYQRLKEKNKHPPTPTPQTTSSLQCGLSNALTPFLPGVLMLLGYSPRQNQRIAPQLISLYKDLGLWSKFLHGKNRLAAQPMLWPKAQTLWQVMTGCGLLNKWQPKQISQICN